MIPNPKYKGEWAPRKITNKNYFVDEHPNRFAPVGGLGFELLDPDGRRLRISAEVARNPDTNQVSWRRTSARPT